MKISFKNNFKKSLKYIILFFLRNKNFTS
jgi:hypothetical protein